MSILKDLLQSDKAKDASKQEDTGESKNKEKGWFEGGDDLTIEDMCIMDILDGDW